MSIKFVTDVIRKERVLVGNPTNPIAKVAIYPSAGQKRIQGAPIFFPRDRIGRAPILCLGKLAVLGLP